MLTEGPITLEAAGAEIIVLCTITMHRLADSIERAITVSFLHIADATAAAIRERDIGTVALLGTRYTMEQPFYRDRVASHGVEVMVPRQHGRAAVHHVGVVPVDPARGRLGIALDRELHEPGDVAVRQTFNEVKGHVDPVRHAVR